jgi:hypothetical protein
MRKMLVLTLALAGCPLHGGTPERLPQGREPSRQRVMDRDAELKRAQAPALDAGPPEVGRLDASPPDSAPARAQ